jgi:hypothetical protein
MDGLHWKLIIAKWGFVKEDSHIDSYKTLGSVPLIFRDKNNTERYSSHFFYF